MKEFVIKHPILTFLIIDEVCTMVTNVAAIIFDNPKRRVRPAIDAALGSLNKAMDKASEKNKEEEAPEDKIEFGFH